MKMNLWTSVLAVGLLGLGVVHGQGPGPIPLPGNASPIATNQVPINNTGVGILPTNPTVIAATPELQSTGPGMSGAVPVIQPGVTDFLAHARPPQCCGPIGGNGPIQMDLFFRPGMSMPFGGGILGKGLNMGFMFEGGGRSLFFNQAQDKAFTVEIGIGSAWYNMGTDKTALLHNIPQPDANGTLQPRDIRVTPSSVNQTWFQLAGGQEWYLQGNANCSDGQPKLRVGWDLGGRWGSAKLVMRELRHRNDVIGGLFIAGHADYEFVFKATQVFVGIRSELGHTWSDILQHQNNADFYSVGVMANMGLRF